MHRLNLVLSIRNLSCDWSTALTSYGNDRQKYENYLRAGPSFPYDVNNETRRMNRLLIEKERDTTAVLRLCTDVLFMVTAGHDWKIKNNNQN